MNRKQLSKKGSVAGIKTMEKDWTVLQNTFNYEALIISRKLERVLAEFTGADKQPRRNQFPYV